MIFQNFHPGIFSYYKSSIISGYIRHENINLEKKKEEPFRAQSSLVSFIFLMDLLHLMSSTLSRIFMMIYGKKLTSTDAVSITR